MRGPFLGFLVNEEGILVDPTKIEAVMQWEVQRYPSDIRSFLGLSGYYQRFIWDFARISVPLTRLKRKGWISGGALTSRGRLRPSVSSCVRL